MPCTLFSRTTNGGCGPTPRTLPEGASDLRVWLSFAEVRKMIISRRVPMAGIAVGLTANVLPSEEAVAASASEIDRNVDNALRVLYSTQPKARNLAQRAKGILVFPKIIKAGFMIGGQTGNGALRINGKTVGYYNISAASFGLQAGGQSFSYALFFMNDSALKYLTASDGWSV